jgi:ABC-2 type transport system permease protein
MIFWTLVFPIALATFFNLAFSNLTEDEKFSPIEIAVVKDSNYEEEKNFHTLLENISKEDENQVFKINYVENEEQAKKQLEENNISGYYLVKDDIEIVIKQSGLNQTIMKYIVDNYYQTQSIIGNIYQFNPQSFKTDMIENLNKEGNYFKDISNENVNFTVVYFYTLIGMVCLYSGFFGINAAKESEANLSKKAARISVSPTHKLKALMAALLAGFLVQFVENLILLAYLVFVLNVGFGDQILWIILLVFVGSFAGISLGTLIGVCNKKSEGIKVATLLSVTMTCSFLAGMMMWQMKYIIANHAPIIGKINPVTMITDALYSLYYYNNLDRYFYNIISLVIFSVIMISISYFFIRRKKYDSI